MRTLSAAVLLCFSLKAQTLRSLQGTGTFPVAGYSTTVPRYEFRIHGSLNPTSNTNVWGVNGQNGCFILANTSTLQCYGWFSTPGGYPQANLLGVDSRVRYNYDATAGSVTLEVWAGDCTDHHKYFINAPPAGTANTSGTVWLSGAGLALAFFRVYAMLDTSGTCPAHAPAAVAPLMDWRWRLARRFIHAWLHARGPRIRRFSDVLPAGCSFRLDYLQASLAHWGGVCAQRRAIGDDGGQRKS
jgi:hypothetical protein